MGKIHNCSFVISSVLKQNSKQRFPYTSLQLHLNKLFQRKERSAHSWRIKITDMIFSAKGDSTCCSLTQNCGKKCSRDAGNLKVAMAISIEGYIRRQELIQCLTCQLEGDLKEKKRQHRRIANIPLAYVWKAN